MARKSFIAIPCLIVALAAQQQSPSVREQVRDLNKEGHAARLSGDKRAQLAAAQKMQKLLNDAPDAVEGVAASYAAVGDSRNALASLGQYAEMEQVDDDLLTGKDKAFTTLHGQSQYRAILDRFADNKKPISLAETALAISDAGVLPEDIDYDPKSNSFLITSVLERKIIRIHLDGATKDFSLSPSRWPMLAIKIDSGRNLVWATEVAMNGFKSVPKADWERSAVLCFNLETGALLHRIEGPAHSQLGDMALTDNGDPIVSDGDQGGVYRVSGDRLTLIDGTDFISPQTPAMIPHSDLAFVPDYARGIGMINLKTGKVIWLNQSDKKRYALNGIDGLYFDKGSLILVQNGTAPERVVRLKLDSTRNRIESEQIVERATETLGDPTHGVVVGDSFYYIAHSGWSDIDEHGTPKAGSKLTPARIMRFHLQ